MPDDILSLAPPPADTRVRYGSETLQFVDLRLPQGHKPFPVVMNIHGGFWRNKYDLAHAGHLCAALTSLGFATWNVEYRRVGDAGGAWPGTFEDITAAYRHIPQVAREFHFDTGRILVMGHSAGGHLALCLAAHEPAVKHAIALAGVVDLQAAFDRHLSNDAVVEFMGGKPDQVPEHYAEADPMKLPIPHARQWLIHGTDDDIVPVDFSRRYVESKKKRGEHAELVEIGKCGHFELIDPRSGPWKEVVAAVKAAV